MPLESLLRVSKLRLLDRAIWKNKLMHAKTGAAKGIATLQGVIGYENEDGRQIFYVSQEQSPPRILKVSNRFNGPILLQ